MRGLIHLVTALFISIIILPIGFLYSVGKLLLNAIDNYFYSIAYNINKLATYVCSDLFNDLIINKKSDSKFLFGKRDVSISYHIGKNLEYNSLSKFGKLLNSILNVIEKDHCIKAVQKEDHVR